MLKSIRNLLASCIGCKIEAQKDVEFTYCLFNPSSQYKESQDQTNKAFAGYDNGAILVGVTLDPT